MIHIYKDSKETNQCNGKVGGFFFVAQIESNLFVLRSILHLRDMFFGGFPGGGSAWREPLVVVCVNGGDVFFVTKHEV